MSKLWSLPVLALACVHAAPAASSALPRNPWLTDSPNNQSHWNDAASDSTDAAVPTGHYCLTPGSFAVAWSDALGIPAYGAEVAGKRVYWFFSGTALRKLHYNDGAWVEIARQPIRMNLPGYRPLPGPAREQQALAFRELLEKGDEAAIGAMIEAQPNRIQMAVEDQVSQGVLYSLFTRNHGFIGANARGLLRIDNIDPADPFSGLTVPQQASLPPDLFDDERVRGATIFPADSVFGLGMTFNGYLVISTLGGVIATVDRDTFSLTLRALKQGGELRASFDEELLDDVLLFFAADQQSGRLDA